MFLKIQIGELETCSKIPKNAKYIGIPLHHQSYNQSVVFRMKPEALPT